MSEHLISRAVGLLPAVFTLATAICTGACGARIATTADGGGAVGDACSGGCGLVIATIDGGGTMAPDATTKIADSGSNPIADVSVTTSDARDASDDATSSSDDADAAGASNDAADTSDDGTTAEASYDAGQNRAVAVSVGNGFACAVTTEGGVVCWGDNKYGVLGIISGSYSAAPVPITALMSGVTAVSLGGSSACALTAAGGVVCWGDNTNGQLGTSGPSSSTPMPVMGLTSGVTAVSVGVYSACAVTAAGGVVCWGDNYYGELGNNGVSPTTCSGWACSPTPVPVTGLSSGVTAVSVGSIFACALTDGGAVMCWGEGAAGDLGNGSTARSDVPVQVTGLTNGVTAISAASASVPASVCALLADGGVLCWGFNNYSATLCLGSIPCFRTPTPAADLPSGVTAVAVGLPSCAVIGDGGVECLEDSYSEFGGSLDAGPSFAPAPVAGFTSGVTAVAVGVTTACALTTAGGLECWGSNGAGQLGNIDQMVGPQAASAVPVEVTGF